MTVRDVTERMKLVVIILFLVTLAFYFGRCEGIRHVIQDSIVFTVDIYDPDDPGASEWNGYDQEIFIEIDGTQYEKGMYQC